VDEVNELIERIRNSRVVGVVGIREIPASNMQMIRSDLRGKVDIRVVRNNIASRALRSSSSDIGQMADYIQDQSALIFSNVNPFQLYKMLEEKKQPMAIRAGSVAPKEIVVEAGDTSFSPGPMVGKLQSAGIPAAIKGGKVVINQRTVLAKEGEVVSSRLAEVLKLMEIYPKNVGLDRQAVYEGGLIFQAKDLTIDVNAIISQLGAASAKALGFALEIGYVTPQTIGPMLQRAQFRARGLVAEGALPVPKMMDIVLSRAVAKAHALAQATGVAKKAEPAHATPEPAAAVEGAKEETTEDKEEALAEGLGSLFG
jgi:large subunit ribosomal protein L10